LEREVGRIYSDQLQYDIQRLKKGPIPNDSRKKDAAVDIMLPWLTEDLE